MKLRVGMEVRIRTDIEEGVRYKLQNGSSMGARATHVAYAGKFVTIKEVHNDYTDVFQIEGNDMWFLSSMIQHKESDLFDMLIRGDITSEEYEDNVKGRDTF